MLYRKGTRPQRQSNIPSAPEGKSCFKQTLASFILLGLVLPIVIGACGAVGDDQEEPKQDWLEAKITATAKAKSSVATARAQYLRLTVTPNVKEGLRPTPTAINEDEHQLWLAWPDHYDDLEKLLREMETNSNSIMAEYRATDPKTIEENTPLQNMEEAVGVALDHVNNSKALCN